MLRRGLFDVQNAVGLGRQEEAYHQAFHPWDPTSLFASPVHRFLVSSGIQSTSRSPILDAAPVELQTNRFRIDSPLLTRCRSPARGRNFDLWSLS
jgi:hypothetical protein